MERKAEVQREPKAADGVQIILLDETWAEQICRVEAACFSHPWGRRAVTDEMFSGLCFGAEIDGELAGFCLMSQILDEGTVLRLAVLPSMRRQGLARRLLTDTLKRGTEQGLCSVFLEVSTENQPALGLYRSIGFAPLQIRKGYYGGGREDALTMVWRKG